LAGPIAAPSQLARRAESEGARGAAEPARPSASAGTFQVASATSKPVRPAQAASLMARTSISANDIINERGYWQGLPSAEPSEATAAPAPARRPVAVASADPATTASVAPWPLIDRTSNEPLPSALAYAAQPTPIAATRALPMGTGTARTSSAGDTTIAVKRSNDRPSVAPQNGRGTHRVRVGDHFNDPWMRAMIVSPSAQGFMKTSLLGVPDFGSLGPFLHKPASTVTMTFSADPHFGMTTEKFLGSAVFFVSTTAFGTRTASLR
jgi:hypothetical protein